jgi:hypothetical protein
MSARYMIVTYMQDPKGKWNEYTEFKNSIKTKHIQTAKVILDFKTKTCVVNSLNREAGFDDMLDMYKRLLGDQLTPHLPKD